MMGKTHRKFALAFTLAGTLGVNLLAVKTGHGLVLAPAGVGLMTATAPFASSGKGSPDVDHTWAPGPPARDYDWRRHRGITHRFWFAFFVITPVFGWLPLAVLLRAGVPLEWAVGVLGPVFGWWSHLGGDMIYGRLKFHYPRVKWEKVSGQWTSRWVMWSVNIGLGWETGGLSETGRSRNGSVAGKFVPNDLAAKVCLILSAALALAHLVLVASVYR